jgi:isovaleryl-CoA dehydrogenase
MNPDDRLVKSTTPTTPLAGGLLTSDHRDILAAADSYARNVLFPFQQRMDDEEWWPSEVFTSLGAQGYLGVQAPEAYGGAGLDLLSEGMVGQAISRWNPAVGLSYLAHENLCLGNLLANADDALLQRFAPGLIDGSLVGALGLTEPGAGSDALGGMRTTAVRDGDEYILNGTKIYITNGPIADVVLVYAKTDLAAGPRGITAFLVETTTPGFSVAQKLIKMGLRGSPTGELLFEDCRVPAVNRVGEEGSGVAVVMNGLDRERVCLAFSCLGLAERAIDLTIAYAQDREQFGSAIGSFQMVASMIAEMYADVESLRSMTLDVATEVGNTEFGAAHQHIATRSAALALVAGNNLMRILDKAVQVHGGMGFMWEAEVNRLYRAGKLYEIGAGTNEVRKSIIASNLLATRAR